MTARDRVHRRLGAGAAILLVVGLGACTSDRAGSGGERGTPAPETSTTASVTPSPAPSETAAPATGPRVAIQYARVRAPRGWKLGADTSGFGVMQALSRQEGWLSLSEDKAGKATSIDQAARVTQRESIHEYYIATRLRRAEDVVLGGDTSGFHLVGADGSLSNVDVVGTLRGEVRFALAIVTDSRLPPARRREIVESVSASWEWTV